MADIIQKITMLRHELHRIPELSLQEQETRGMVRAFLTENTTLEVHDCGNWLYAKKNGRNGCGRGIAFRADLDALPMEEGISLPYASTHAGISHKCGHDGHTAVLCGLAMELEEMTPERDVYLIFQPAEEIGRGGEECAAFLEKEGIEEVYAFHNLSGYPEGTVIFRHGLTQPASEGLILAFHGKTSHASAPEEGINPAKTVAELILFAGKKAETLHLESGEMVLCTVVGCRIGSGDFGISPADGELRLTLRAERESAMKELEREILHYAQENAPAGMQIRHEISDYFPETRNEEICLAKALQAAKRVGLETQEMKSLWRASEDFGYYTKKCPGAMVYIGNGENYPALHTREYDFNDRILEKAVNLFKELI